MKMKTISNFTEWYEDEELIENYIKNSPKIKAVDWFDLPAETHFLLKEFPKEVKQIGKSNFVSSRRLKNFYGNDKSLNEKIIGIKKYMRGNKYLEINFPINLKTREYVKLYALMVSEGYTRSEFSIHVPEKYFHDIFKKNIHYLVNSNFANEIRVGLSNGFLRSRAPAKIRHLIPIPKHLPSMILENKEFAREYLRIAFDAEGSAILNEKQHKRYIKLSRYVDITNFVEEKLPLQKRIFTNKIKDKYPALFEKIKYYPPKTLLGEYILLKKYFGINSKLRLEAIKKNKTSFRAGGTTARWVLFIYADNIDVFIKEINFISEEKRKKCELMTKIKANKPQYSTLQFIEKISKNSVVLRKDFISEMKKEGYKSPGCYMHRFEKKGIIKRIGKGKYTIC